MSRLPVVILWHLHQPLYRLPSEQTYRFPWVRLHTLREYHDMAAMIERFPEVPVTVNWTPVLLQQIDEYTRGFQDVMQKLRDPKPESLTPNERYQLLNGAFKAHPDTIIHPYPRFRTLHQKWKRLRGDSTREQVAREFSDQELRDVQVWSTLAWFGFSARQKHPEITQLRQRDQQFDEEDKQTLRDLEESLMASCIPRWKKIFQGTPVECSTTPYYHPIAPLLCDYETIHDALPDVPRPERTIRWPEDVRWHLREARRSVDRHFDLDEVGLWPSEGSLSDEFLGLIDDAEFTWTASDEALLRGALTGRRDGTISAEDRYCAYRWKDRLPVLFRDHELSDRIGFEYSKQSVQDALDDFFGYLGDVASRTRASRKGRVCAVILDGENPWEYFTDGGEGFLGGLYEGLLDHDLLQPVTPTAFLESNPDLPELNSIPSGSWINGDFGIWAASSIDVRAWELLAETREALQAWDELSDEQSKRCWETIYALEGSDWFWWYGEPFQSAEDEVFDELFREMLIYIYETGGHPEPSYLHHPMQSSESPGYEPPRNFIHPVIDGRESHHREWWGAARIVHRMEMGTMARSSERFRSIRFGSDLETIYARIEFENPPPPDTRVRLSLNDQPLLMGPLSQRQGTLTDSASGEPVPESVWCYERLLEFSVPMGCLDLDPGQYARFRVELLQDEGVFDRFPFQTPLAIPLLDRKSEAREWTV